MSLADRLAQMEAGNFTGVAGPICGTGAWLSELTPADRELFERSAELVAAHRVQMMALWRACREEGLSVGSNSFSRHLKGVCQCR